MQIATGLENGVARTGLTSAGIDVMTGWTSGVIDVMTGSTAGLTAATTVGMIAGEPPNAAGTVGIGGTAIQAGRGLAGGQPGHGR